MKKKILIIDDDIITLRILKKYLETDYEVQIENAGYRFLERLDEYFADIILLDIEMPVLNGLQVFNQLKSHEQFKSIPVIFLSGISDNNIVREVMEHGAAGFVVKTAPKSELLDKIEKIYLSYEGLKERTKTLIIYHDLLVLKNMKNVLSEICQVTLCPTMLEAVEQLRKKEMQLVVIGRDEMGTEPEMIRTKLTEMFGQNTYRFLVLEEQFDPDDFYKKVGQMIE